jgi:hypothetical protein
MYKLKTTLFFLILIIVVNVSCRNLFRKDLSFTLKEYEERGMPDIKNPWSERDLMKAHITLGTIRTKSFQSMPRKESSRSGALFSRIVSKDNLAFLNDPGMALHDMAFQIQTTSSFLNDLGRMYTDNLKPQQYYHEELIEIFIYEIFVKEKMLELAERIKNSKVPDDISMQRGHKSIVNGYVNLITTMIKNQEKTKAFSARELRRLNKEVAVSISNNIKYLDSESKQKLTEEIKSISEKSGSRYVKKDFADVLKGLKD